MKLVKTEDAVGQVLCHDITQIIRGVKKDAVFRKGHVVTEEDIPVLLSVGKDNLYVWENDDTMMHENDAAQVLYDICKSENIRPSEVKEGKIEIFATCDGLLKIDRDKLNMVNSFGRMLISSRHGDFAVKEGDKIAGMKVVPLVIEKKKMEEVREKAGKGEIFKVIPFRERKVGVVTTGNEVYYGRIKDTFTPVIEDKMAEFGGRMVSHRCSSDDPQQIVQCIHEVLDEGAEVVICTGGMSVDPDDKTPYAIREVCGDVVTYGAPVFPGAMFLLAYYGENRIPVIGVPGCVMYARRTIFDLVLPRIMADDIITKDELDRLGEGGLCLNCKGCTFPDCGFGK